MLSDTDKRIYEWQLNVSGFGEAGQQKLRNSTAQIATLEGIKLLTGMGEAQTDTLIHVDSLSMNMRKIKVRRNPNCQHCGS